MSFTIGTASVTGNILSFFWGGWTIGEGYRYFSQYGAEDQLLVRVVMGLACFLQLLGLSANMGNFVLKFGVHLADLEFQDVFTGGYYTTTLATALITLLVQSWYSYRCWILFNRAFWPPLIAMLPALGCTVMFLWNIVAVIRAGRGSALFGVGFKLAPGLPYILAAICDIELSVMMLFGLWRAKRVGADQGSGRIITRLVKITIETNVLVTVINIIAAVTFIAESPVHYLIEPLVPISYIYCLVVWMHSRSQTRRTMQGIGASNGNTTSRQKGFRRGDQGSVSAVRVQVFTETATVVDKNDGSVYELDEKRATESA